jgi:hypothetical protein
MAVHAFVQSGHIAVQVLRLQRGRGMGKHSRSTDAPGSKLSPQALHDLAMKGAVWGTPIVAFDVMRQAFLHGAGARYHDVVYWSRPADWKLQITTPNASSRYVLINFNTQAGAMVLEIPRAEGAGLFGSILDAWQVPMIDVGPQGADLGDGGRYLLLPPGRPSDVPAGYIPVQLATYNSYAAFRAIPESSSPNDVQRALELIKKIHIYPLASGGPKPPQFIDMAGALFDGIMRFDARFYASLARMIDEEPPLGRDRDMLESLRELGIVQGRDFAPDPALMQILETAARDTHAYYRSRAPRDGNPFWPSKQWRLPSSIGPRTHFTYEEQGRLDYETRGLFYFLACAPPARLGKASAYLHTFVDDDGEPLVGDRAYRLHVPANVPAKQFWAATVYDLDTSAFVRESPRVEVSSYDTALARNADGSCDVLFAAKPPATNPANWVATPPGKRWFTIFRFYGPEPALFDQSWMLPDLTKVTP